MNYSKFQFVKSKERFIQVLVFVCICVFVLIIVVISFFKKGKVGIDEVVSDGERVKILDYSEVGGLYPNPAYFTCINRSSRTVSDVARGEYFFEEEFMENVNVGDDIACIFSVDVEKTLDITSLSYDMDISKGLELVDFSYDKSKASVVVNNTKTEITLKNPTSHLNELNLIYRFKVKDGASNENLRIFASNIVFGIVSHEYYSLKPVEFFFQLQGTSPRQYYIYRRSDTPHGKLISYSKPTDSEEDKFIGIYRCKQNDCEDSPYNRGYTGDYLLFNDGGRLAYNVVTKEKISLEKFDDYEHIDLVADDKLHGLILTKAEKDPSKNDSTLYFEGFYSFAKNDFILPMKKDQEIYNRKGYVYVKTSPVSKLLDYNGNTYIPKQEELTRFADTDFYYMDDGIDEFPTGGYIGYRSKDEGDKFLYTKSGKPLLTDKKVYIGHYDNRSTLMKGNGNTVLIAEDKKFVEYDINGNVTYESSEFLDINMYKKELFVVDKEHMLKIIDNREKTLILFDKIEDISKIAWYHASAHPSVPYLYVYDSTVTIDDIKKYGSQSDKDYIDRFPKEDYSKHIGYHYEYSVDTGKVVKTPALIVGGFEKPVLYLYPKEDNTRVTVSFSHPSLLTTTYPRYDRYWSVTANRNGDLYDDNGKYYYGLYWEEDGVSSVDFSTGFFVTKDNAISFLEDKLSHLGLNDKERNEFIMYWLPVLEKNGNSLVYFELTDERESFNSLRITPRPDSLLRLSIHIKKVDGYTNVKEQKLPSFERKGFSAIEWGGMVH